MSGPREEVDERFMSDVALLLGLPIPPSRLKRVRPLVQGNWQMGRKVDAIKPDKGDDPYAFVAWVRQRGHEK